MSPARPITYEEAKLLHDERALNRLFAAMERPAARCCDCGAPLDTAQEMRCIGCVLARSRRMREERRARQLDAEAAMCRPADEAEEHAVGRDFLTPAERRAEDDEAEQADAANDAERDRDLQP